MSATGRSASAVRSALIATSERGGGLAVVSGIGGDERVRRQYIDEGLHRWQQHVLFGARAMRLRLDDQALREDRADQVAAAVGRSTTADDRASPR
jgi:hypothetical protein